MKKIVLLFITLFIVVGTVFADENPINMLDQIRVYYLDFNRKQIEYAINSNDQNELQQEKSFKELYSDYLDYYKKASDYSTMPIFTIDEQYAKSNQHEYARIGLGFDVSVDSWYLVPDYTMLLDTPAIPKHWKDWLNLQQKYRIKHREKCIKAFEKGKIQDGCNMTMAELEKAITEFEEVEKQSGVISSVKSSDFLSVPYTSFDFICNYFYGDAFGTRFDTDDNDISKLQNNAKKSYKHFIKNHRNSKYWPIIEQYYTMLKNDKFIKTEDTSLWLFWTIQGIQSFY